MLSVSFFEDFVDQGEKLVTYFSGGSGSANREDSPGGIIRLTTGTTAGQETGIYAGSFFIDIRRRPVASVNIKTPSNQNQTVYLYLLDSGASNIIGLYRVDGSNYGQWQFQTRKSGVDAVSAIPLSGTSSFTELMLEMSPFEVRVLIDGAIVHVFNDVSKIPTGPLYRIQTWIVTDAYAAKTMDVDYIAVTAAR